MTKEDIAWVVETLEGLFKTDDMAIDASFKAHNIKVSCGKGCNSCCMMFTLITIADGIYLADEVLKRKDWGDLLSRMTEEAKAHCYDGINESNWFQKRRQCVFLKDGICSVYAKRPAACRHHFVTTAPENCTPDAALSGKPVTMLDMRHFNEHTSWAISRMISPILHSAPIPLMTLFCAEILVDADMHPDKKEVIKNALKGLPDPGRWVNTYGREFFLREAASLLKTSVKTQKTG